MESITCQFVTSGVTENYPSEVTTQTALECGLQSFFWQGLPELPFSDGQVPWRIFHADCTSRGDPLNAPDGASFCVAPGPPSRLGAKPATARLSGLRARRGYLSQNRPMKGPGVVWGQVRAPGCSRGFRGPGRRQRPCRGLGHEKGRPGAALRVRSWWRGYGVEVGSS